MIPIERTEEVLKKYEEVKSIFSKASMNIREFFSNDKCFNAQLPSYDLAEQSICSGNLCETEFDNVLDFCQIKSSPKQNDDDTETRTISNLNWGKSSSICHQTIGENSQVILWSNSRCALHWIQNHSRLLSRFIQNRVEEIRKAKFAHRYIPSECNPADIATKGISSDLANLTLCDNEETIDEEGEQVVIIAIQEAITKTSISFLMQIGSAIGHEWSELPTVSRGNKEAYLDYVMGLWKFRGRLQFPSSGRTEVKRVLNKCYGCKRWKAKSFKLPLMPDYHDSRTVRSRIFARIGLDHLGPVTAKTEVRMAKRRFVARRGCPELILSDNASQFHLVYRTIKKQESQLSNFLTSKGIIWKCITPMAPWSGGIYERIVGITKGAFRKAVEHKSPRGAITRPPSLGEVVLVNEPHIPRGMWKVAKINKLNKSSDGDVRSVQIELPFGKLLNRPVNMLYPLEVEQEDQPEEFVTELMDAKDEEPIARRTRSSTKELRTAAVIENALSYQPQFLPLASIAVSSNNNNNNDNNNNAPAFFMKKRTILLTTHYMDEADILGDRITILANDQVQYTASEYRLTVEYNEDKKGDDHAAAVLKTLTLLREFILGATVHSSNDFEVILLLPADQRQK
ncbi:Pao retrotransposon peptidase family protein [Dirofilaria immitis]|nr:Pao retrotransposon peptidase family protein [Dirofilaria immitis]